MMKSIKNTLILLLLSGIFLNTKAQKKINKPVTKAPISMAKTTEKLFIYQITAQLWGNQNSTNKVYGSITDNGCGKMAYLSDTALKALKDYGYTHIWVMGLLESATLVDNSAYGIAKDHPAIVKGVAGSAFAVKDYYDINPNLAVDIPNRMAEFEAMTQRIHAAGLKLIMDFVPNHVARQYYSDAKPAGAQDFGATDNNSVIFDPQNNFYYLPGTEFLVPEGVKPAVTQDSFYEEKPAKVTGNDVFKAEPDQNDWYETVKLNYGVNILNNHSKHFSPTPNTWLKMTDILLYWAAKGVDGFRCDMAEMVPVEFWAYAIPKVKAQYKNTLFIAEIYKPKLYESYIKTGGFDYLYDKVGLYDALRRLIEDRPEANTAHITNVWQHESGHISQHMLRFLENHDEQRIASQFFAKDAFRATPAMALAATLHTGPVMVFFGQELGEAANEAEGYSGNDGRTTKFDFWGLKTMQAWSNHGKYDGAKLNPEQKKLQKFYKDLIAFCSKSNAVSNGGFYDLQYANNYTAANKSKIYSYLRHTGSEVLLFVYNFDQHNSHNIQVNIPAHAREVAGFVLNQGKQYKTVFTNKPELYTVTGSGFQLALAANSFKVLKIK
jgi:glycosidase